MSDDQIYRNSDFIIEFRKATEDEIPPATASALMRLPDGWEKMMLSLYEQGCSDSEIMKELRIKPKDFRQLLEDRHSCNFHEIVEVGRMLSRAWWEALGRTHIKAKGINVSMYSLHMQNRFGWAQKSEESKTNIEVSQNADEIDEKLAEYLRRLDAKSS